MNTAHTSGHSLEQLESRQSQDVHARHIAELIVPNFNDNDSVILPIAASLSVHQSEKWTTWITHKIPSKSQLTMMGANLSRLRLIHINEHSDVRWIIWQALAQGNSHAVIAEQRAWSKEDIKDMEAAAKNGHTQGILVTLHH
jgi:cell division inhibitor SulA